MINANTQEKNIINKFMDACESAEIPVYSRDFLCRTLAILYCYGGGPGGEYFRASTGHAVIMKGQDMLEKAVLQKDWETVRLFRAYVKELQKNCADWLPSTLEKLNIPPAGIRFSECVQPKSPRGA